MQASKSTLKLRARPLSALAATVVLALAASLTQTAHAAPWGGHRGPGDGPGGFEGPGLVWAAPHQIDRLLDAANASADQRSQVHQILKTAHADLKPLHEAGRKLHEQGLALLTAPTVDAAAAEALRQQLLVQHDQASKRTLQALLDVSRVLTPEQRKALADRAAKRRALFDRHRAEREAIDPPPKR
jgi:Spy/CpxP family protein refolding chaperone